MNVDDKKCGPTHHFACDCRENMFAEKIADLEQKLESAEMRARDFAADCDRLKKENERLNSVIKEMCITTKVGE